MSYVQSAHGVSHYDFYLNRILSVEMCIRDRSYRSPLGPDAPADAASKALKFFNALQEEYNKRQFLVPGDMKMQRFMESID